LSTKTLNLIKHGDYIASGLESVGPEEPAEVQGKDALSGVARRFTPRAPCSDDPTALNTIRAVYPNAIELMGATSTTQLRGIMILVALGLLGFCAFIFPFGIQIFWEAIQILDGQALFTMLSVVIAAWVAWRFGLAPIPGLLRADLFAPDNQPLIFDRKHQRVYRLFDPNQDQAKDRWWTRKPLLLQGVEYHWSCITAEHRVQIITRGNSVTRVHGLVLVARDFPKKNEPQGRLLDEFPVTSSMLLGETTVPRLWEHLRRYMEDNGPALPEGEVLQNDERPKTLWQSLGVVSPFGPQFLRWWRDSRLMTIFVFIGLPITLPVFTLWGMGNWLSHQTMRPTIWPKEVHERIGQPLQAA
jgi:hypothetical protein